MEHELPSDADDLTHHIPNSFLAQRPCPLLRHVLHKFCLE